MWSEETSGCFLTSSNDAEGIINIHSLNVFFYPLINRKVIEVKIIDDEEYEKNKTFTIELGEPVLLEIGQKHGGSASPSTLYWNNKGVLSTERIYHLETQSYLYWLSELWLILETLRFKAWQRWIGQDLTTFLNREGNSQTNAMSCN